MDRREFLGLGTCFAACSALGGKQGATIGKGSVRATFGVLSDVHVRNAISAEKNLLPALTWFRGNAVDGVVCCGDMTDTGFRNQLEAFAAVWHQVFPDGRGANGKKVEKLFVYGNHDIDGFKYGKFDSALVAKDAIGLENRRKTFYEDLFHEKWEPLWLKKVNGYAFVGLNYGHTADTMWNSNGRWSGVYDLEAFLAEHREELPSDKPFFYLQHIHPAGTCLSPWTWLVDNGQSTKVLSKWPNAVAISGHSHHILTNDQSVWRGAFTSINAGSTQCGNLDLTGGRENSHFYVIGKNTEDSGEQMPSQEGTGDASHAMIMRIYDDGIVLVRRELTRGESLGPDLKIPWPPQPADYAQRGRETPVPSFAPDATVSINRGTGRNRAGQETEQLTVTFPTAVADGIRAYDYEVRAEVRDCDVEYVWRAKRVFSPQVQYGVKSDGQPVTCVFALDELPRPYANSTQRQLRFAVQPCNAYGGKGAAITSAWKEPERR